MTDAAFDGFGDPIAETDQAKAAALDRLRAADGYFLVTLDEGGIESSLLLAGADISEGRDMVSEAGNCAAKAYKLIMEAAEASSVDLRMEQQTKTFQRMIWELREATRRTTNVRWAMLALAAVNLVFVVVNLAERL
jgi:hypothetical protein